MFCTLNTALFTPFTLLYCTVAYTYTHTQYTYMYIHDFHGSWIIQKRFLNIKKVLEGKYV